MKAGTNIRNVFFIFFLLLAPLALPDQPVGGLTRGIEHDELIVAGEFILAALVASDPTRNQADSR
jgi:hypothetical protein